MDYGSSHTVAALRGDDGRGRLLLFDSAPLLPSAVCADADGTLVGGQEARHLSRRFPDRYEPTPKRRLDAGELLLGTDTYPVVEAIAVTLRLVADVAAETAGRRPDTVTLTHPAAWAATRRGMLVDAARRAGLPEPRLVPEPVAAARFFQSLPQRPADPLVVYDLGAGTCDVSVLCDGQVVAVDGLPDLGGADLDALVVRLLTEAVPDRRTPDPRQTRMLWEDARTAKELLSRRAGTHVYLQTWDRDVPVGREEFERLAEPLLAGTAELTARLIDRAGVGRPGGILLVGGAARTPVVATLLHRATGIAPTVLDQPELVVAQGGLLDVPEPVPPAGTEPVPIGAAPPPPDDAVPAEPATPPVRRWWLGPRGLAWWLALQLALFVPLVWDEIALSVVGAVVGLLLSGTAIWVLGRSITPGVRVRRWATAAAVLAGLAAVTVVSSYQLFAGDARHDGFGIAVGVLAFAVGAAAAFAGRVRRGARLAATAIAATHLYGVGLATVFLISAGANTSDPSLFTPAVWIVGPAVLVAVAGAVALHRCGAVPAGMVPGMRERARAAAEHE